MFFSVVATGFLTGAGLIMAIGTQNAFVLRQGLERSHVGLVVAICALADIVLILGAWLALVRWYRNGLVCCKFCALVARLFWPGMGCWPRSGPGRVKEA